MSFDLDDKQTVAHFDVNKNIDYYKSMLAKVKFDPEVAVNVQMDRGEWMCAFFVFGPPPIPGDHGCGGMRKGSFLIAFSQDWKCFKIELCGILNTLGSMGLLERVRPVW